MCIADDLDASALQRDIPLLRDWLAYLLWSEGRLTVPAPAREVPDRGFETNEPVSVCWGRRGRPLKEGLFALWFAGH